MRNRLLIIGCGGHGRVVADAALELGYQQIAFLDDGMEPGATPLGPVLGPTKLLGEVARDWPAAIAAIGHNRAREQFLAQIKDAGLAPTSIIHPSAIVSRRATIAEGVFIAAGAIVAVGSRIGEGTILNTGAQVDHDCTVGPLCHIAPGATLSGSVTVGARTWLGTNSSVKQGISIANDVMVGVGAVVVRNLDESRTYAGVPACPLPSR